MSSDYTIQQGWSNAQSREAAALYEEAFGSKFARAIGDKQQRVDLLAASMLPEYAYAVFDENRLIALAGFQTPKGSLTGKLSFFGLLKVLGFFRGLWAAVVFSLFEREAEDSELVMDGIVVDPAYRNKGLGSLLLERIINHAQENGFHSVRLDVIDNNPRAKKLYEKKGFSTIKTAYFPHLKWLIGFSGATTMSYQVQSEKID